ncbi:helix-turn-helix domain-containing protein [Vibrio nigripulchritudo]|uniref:helix-turn-helix domain-containing protein n=1 Tax=Vibrio nigripulchritudo TaxID=28173 RepID=UPI0005FA8848|nr:helix-turn-helix domain-containing protein [Vibrio nigripulchritudo]KJY75257.1 hypothetical protein TW74_18165 [Vibrio nigripulchritudo]
MHQANIIEIWKSKADADKRAFVIPDGCQDVIIVQPNQASPVVNVSPLYTQTIAVDIEKGTEMLGFRLQPGCSFKGLDLAALKQKPFDETWLEDYIENNTRVNDNVWELLQCIRKEPGDITSIAAVLGISIRTLQRTLKQHTSQSPLFWLRLARVRQCAKAIITSGNHSDIAYDFQYSDQAHMCREVKHWLGVTPTQLATRQDIRAQLFDEGY